MLYRCISEDLKRLIMKKTAWLSAIVYVAIGYGNFVFIMSEQPFVNPNFIQPSAFEYFVQAQGGGSGFLIILLPFLVTLGTGDFLIKEKQSSMMSYYLTICSNMAYIRNRIISLGLTSFVFIFVCQMFLFCVALFLFPIEMPLEQNQGMIFYALDLLMSNPWLYTFIIIINSCLMAFCFSTISIAVSLVVRNFYAAVMLPYFLFVVFSEILNGLPLIFGIQSLPFHHFSPSGMVGSYISIHDKLFVVPLYWILFGGLSTILTTIVFFYRLKTDKLIAV